MKTLELGKRRPMATRPNKHDADMYRARMNLLGAIVLGAAIVVAAYFIG